MVTRTPARFVADTEKVIEHVRQITALGGDVTMDTPGGNFRFLFEAPGLSDPASPARQSSLAQLSDIAHLAYRTFTVPGILRFLVNPQPIFGYRGGLALLLRGDYGAVRAALISVYEGLGD